MRKKTYRKYKEPRKELTVGKKELKNEITMRIME